MTVHLLTPEYPPMLGGVADYTSCVAGALAHSGRAVHVWCPPLAAHTPVRGVNVHEECGVFAAPDLERVGRLLDRFEQPRRLIVQWVPHGYGARSMNLGFCAWLWKRARLGDRIELMVHEPYLALWEGSWRQTAAASVQRVMTMMLLRAARKVWVAIPAWQGMWQPYALGRAVPFQWLPVPSALMRQASDDVSALRRRLGSGPLVGHVGTYGPLITNLLDGIIAELVRGDPMIRVALLGTGSRQYAGSLVKQLPDLDGRLFAAGTLSADDLALHVSACDVLAQPFPDGVSSRRTSVMAGMNLGVPVVTTRGRLTEPFWESSRAVTLADAGDSAAFAEHVRRLIRSPHERKHLAGAARRLYDEQFDVDRIARVLGAA